MGGKVSFQKGTFKVIFDYNKKGHCIYEDPELDNFSIALNIEKVEEGIRCIRIKNEQGNKLEFLRVFNELKEALKESDLIL